MILLVKYTNSIHVICNISKDVSELGMIDMETLRWIFVATMLILLYYILAYAYRLYTKLVFWLLLLCSCLSGLLKCVDHSVLTSCTI